MAGLKVIVAKSKFMNDVIKYVGYKFSRYEMSLLPNEVQDKLAISLFKKKL